MVSEAASVKRERLISQSVDSALYVSAGDSLLVSLWQTTIGGVTVSVNVRLLLTTGEIVSVNRDVVLSAVATRQDFTFPLYDGWLIQICVLAPLSAIAYGVLFGRVDLLQGSVLVVQRRNLVTAGYISSSRGIVWPGGQMEDSGDPDGDMIITTRANPGAGNQWTNPAAGSDRVQLRGVSALLTTSATVATRQVYFKYSVGGTEIFRSPANGTQLASLARTYVGLWGLSGIAAAGAFIFVALPMIRQPALCVVDSAVDNMQAGDTWTLIQVSEVPLLSSLV